MASALTNPLPFPTPQPPTEHDFSIDSLKKSMSETWSNMTESTPGDPNVEDLQKALGPSPPDGYICLIIAVEGVLLRREWDVSVILVKMCLARMQIV